jgi:hypothetical protein
VDRWKRLGFRSRAWERALNLTKIKRLIELRNQIMHRAETRELEKSECVELARAARTLILHGASLMS